MIRKILCRLGFHNHIKKLKDERNKMIIRRDVNSLLLSPLYEKTFEYAHLNLAIKFWELKIEFWKAIIGDYK